MDLERLKQIDEDAIQGRSPAPFTVQAMCAEIRILMRAIEEQRQIIVALRAEKPMSEIGRALFDVCRPTRSQG